MKADNRDSQRPVWIPSVKGQAKLVLLALLPALLLGAISMGCGYALVGRGSNIPESVEAVYLEALVNRTQRSQVDQFLTRAIADELTTRRLFDLLGGPEGADAVLKGSVDNFAVTPITFDSQGLAREYEISITAKMSFVEIGTDEVIWSNDRYLFRENYTVEEVGTNYLDRENDAIERAAKNFAETMVSDLLEGF